MGVKIFDRDRGLNRLIRGLKAMSGGLWAHIGIQGAAADESGSRDGPVSNVVLGVIHEFGAANDRPPARPFLRPVADERKAHWNKRLSEEYAKVVVEQADPRRALMVVGEEFRAAVIDRIKGGIAPPLKAATIKRKGESTPLIDTGSLIGSISVVLSKDRK